MRLSKMSWGFAAALVASCGSSSSSNDETDEGMRLAQFQVMSKQQLENVLKDADSAKYQDVHAYKQVNNSGQTAYIFCGRVNSKNGFGGYGGYQRFVATATLAALEEQASDFDEVWTQFCNGKEETIWW